MRCSLCSLRYRRFLKKLPNSKIVDATTNVKMIRKNARSLPVLSIQNVAHMMMIISATLILEYLMLSSFKEARMSLCFSLKIS